MIPIAGMIISAILCYELITMVMDKNNMHEVGSEFFFRYLIKACIAVLLLSYTFDITMAIFDVGNHIVTRAGGIVSGSTTIDVTDTLKTMFDSQIDTMGIGELIGLGIETMIVSLCMKIISLLITVMLFGRMIEIYLYISVAPVPFSHSSATGNGEQSERTISKGLCCTGVSGIFHYGMRGNLCCAGIQHRGCGQPAQRIMVGSGIYRNPVFQPVQDRLFKRNQSSMPIRTHFKERREQPGLAVSAPAVNVMAISVAVPKESKWHKDKSSVKSYQKPDYLL